MGTMKVLELSASMDEPLPEEDLPNWDVIVDAAFADPAMEAACKVEAERLSALRQAKAAKAVLLRPEM
jgi:hypothetical protein